MTTLATLPTGGAQCVVYLGTPEVAVPPLRALVAAGVKIALVITRPDKRRGRGSDLSPSPVKEAALQLGLPVSHELSDALAVHADLGVVVAYGRIIPLSMLQKLPMINLHFSLLPRWRGAAPVERALLAGDSHTGVCIMRVEEGLDTGEVFERVSIPIRTDHTLTSLRSDLVQTSLTPLVRAVLQGFGKGTPQSGDITHANKIAPHELQIHFTMSARSVVALTLLETAWFLLADKRVRVLHAKVDETTVATTSLPGQILGMSDDGVRVACGDGVVMLLTVQPEGKKPMSAKAWANGAHLPSSLA